MSIGAIVVTVADVIEPCINEVNSLGREIKSEGIWPVELLRHNDSAATAVQPGGLNAGVTPPVSPEQPPHTEGVQYIIFMLKNCTGKCCLYCHYLGKIKLILIILILKGKHSTQLRGTRGREMTLIK